MAIRKAKQRTKVTQVPAWLTHYLETGEEPEPGTADDREFHAWYLIAGHGEGKGWPAPQYQTDALRNHE